MPLPSDSPPSTALSRASLATLVDAAAAQTAAGAPLDELFLAVAEDADDRRLRAVSLRLADELARGADLSAALGTIAGAMPQRLRHALAAAADVGQTAAVLQALARHETARKRVSRQLYSALLYPAIVLAMVLGVLATFVFYILPEYVTIYEDFDVELPPSTMLLLGTAEAMPWIAAGAAAVAAGYFLLWLFPRGRRLAHWLRTGAPLVGRVWIGQAQHELASMLGALVSQQIPLDQALDCTAAALRDRNLARAARIAAAKCRDGATLAHSLAESMHVEPSLPALAGWGEAHGRLPEALAQAAALHEEEITLYANFLRRALPPLLFVGVMATVFALMAAVFEPLATLMNNFMWMAPPTRPWWPTGTEVIEVLARPSATLLLLGGCLWASLRLLYGARGPAPDDAVYLFIRILSRSLVAAALVVLFVASGNWLSLILGVIVLQAAMELILARRAGQRQAAWSALTPVLSSPHVAVESLAFHQSRFTGLVARWFRRLLADVQRGVSWPEAISANRRALPREAPSHLGMLQSSAGGAALRDLQHDEDPASRQVWHDAIDRFAYLSTILLTLVVVMTFSMVKIVPSYQQIIADFDLEMPGVTQFLIALANGIEQLGVVLLFAAVALLAAAMFVAVAYLCDWHVLQPLFDRIAFPRRRASVLRLLAAALERDAPLPEALARLESGWSAYPSQLVRRRIGAAREEIIAGRPWQEALQRHRLLSAADAATLRAAQDAGNLPWTLRLLADRTLRRFAFRWTVVQHVLFTATILLLGFLVLLFAVGMFVPLTSMVESLSV